MIPLIEPDVLIDRIGQMGSRKDEHIPFDDVGIDARVNQIKTLLLAFPTSAATYEDRRERYVKIQKAFLDLAGFGGEHEALGLSGPLIDVYFEIIPLDKRVAEYMDRLAHEF